jgi:hypothetical protein
VAERLIGRDGGVVCRRNRGLVGNIRGEVRNVGIKLSLREREREDQLNEDEDEENSIILFD